MATKYKCAICDHRYHKKKVFKGMRKLYGFKHLSG